MQVLTQGQSYILHHRTPLNWLGLLKSHIGQRTWVESSAAGQGGGAVAWLWDDVTGAEAGSVPAGS